MSFPPSVADDDTRRDMVASLRVLIDLFEGFGGTDFAYLRDHYGRFAATLGEFDGSWDRNRGVHVLDVGAHWLHQAVLWRRAGYEVTALDLPTTFELDSVRSCAAAEGIHLIPNSDLERCTPLAALPDASFNVVLFTEIIEHVTFNPTRLWREIHRLLAPGGRIIVTTPNYYGWNKRAWNALRFLTGRGGGISVEEILGTGTHGHHWREFSRRELARYFELLSQDFKITKSKTMRSYGPGSLRWWVPLARLAFESFPGLRPNLHLEVELTSHQHGIVMKPSW